MGKQLSGAQKRKKRKEKEELAKEAVEEMERLKLGPTELWTGLVLHHKDVFVSHVLPKLNRTDRFFFKKVNRESWDVLKYAGVNVSRLHSTVWECSSISTLELLWNNMPWGEKDKRGRVVDRAWFCKEVAGTNKLELLKWAREVKQCQWDEWTITVAAEKGISRCSSTASLMVARVMKKSRVLELLQEETSTVFGFFSTKWNLRERRKEKRQCKQHAVVTWTS